jgi:NAD(P)-dependent dehydrogenase (short-subunit alcohol dehydrogenase family)
MNFRNGKLLYNQKAIITGASRGIGLETAIVFAQEGATLVLTELEERMADLAEQAEYIKDKFSVDVIIHCLDIRKYDQVKKVVQSIEESCNSIDILVNNAGVNLLASILNLTWEQWDFVLDTNLKGTFFMSQEVVKVMIKNKKGSIISIASQHGIVGNENRAAYCASKAGLINLTRVLALELARHGIRANTVSPTFVLTEQNETILNSNNFKYANLNKIPLRKYASPGDIAEAVLFLSSDLSKMVTGHNLVVDGGWTAV